MKYTFLQANKILFTRMLLLIWQFPQFIVSLIMIPFLGDLKFVASRHNNWCIEGSKMKGGISLGPLCFVSPNARKAVIAHELDGHTVDSKILGPLYLFVIGIPSLLWACYHTYSSTKRNYYSFYTERLANKHANLIVTKQGYIDFKHSL